MDLFVVYPPSDSGLEGTLTYEHLGDIPEGLTRDNGFRCFKQDISDNSIVNKGAQYTTESNGVEVLETWDRQRFASRRPPSLKGPAINEYWDHIRSEIRRINRMALDRLQHKGDAADSVTLVSSVEGVPDMICGLLKQPAGDNTPVFQLNSAMDVQAILFGGALRDFPSPRTLQPELYKLNPDLTPVVFQGGKRAAG